MRRRYYVKSALILSMSAALTFHFVKLWVNPNSQQALEEKDSDLSEVLDLTLTEIETPGWIVLPGNITVHTGKQNNQQQISYISYAETLCRTLDDKRMKLLIFVPSRTDHFDKRQAIRDTWGLRALQEALNFRVLFILGILGSNFTNIISKVQEENRRFGDILQVSIPETYRNLGLKSLTGIRWSNAYCDQADFVMKTDDDLFLHIPNLISAIQSAKDHKTLLLCRQNQKSRILRKNTNDELPWLFKYEVAEKELPGRFYPPYCSGMAYVFSKAVRNRLLQACSTTPVFFIEDVYLTGFCRHKAGINITAHPGISLSPPMTPEQAVCSFRDGRLTSQEVNPSELRRFWNVINTQGFFCPETLGYVRDQPSFNIKNRNHTQVKKLVMKWDR